MRRFYEMRRRLYGLCVKVHLALLNYVRIVRCHRRRHFVAYKWSWGYVIVRALIALLPDYCIMSRERLSELSPLMVNDK